MISSILPSFRFQRSLLVLAVFAGTLSSCSADPRAKHTDLRQYTFVGTSNGRNVEITVEAELAARSAIPLSNFNKIIDDNQPKFESNLGKRLAALPAEIGDDVIASELNKRATALDKQLQRDTLNKLRLENIEVIASNIYAESAQANFIAFLNSPMGQTLNGGVCSGIDSPTPDGNPLLGDGYVSCPVSTKVANKITGLPQQFNAQCSVTPNAGCKVDEDANADMPRFIPEG